MIGRLLDGRYKILQVLGSGGFSETYLAQDTRRPGSPYCVVKLLKPNTNNPNSLQISRRLFQSEAETLERLGNYSQIPRLLAYFEEKQEFYLVQEYIKGHLLSTEFTPEKPYTEQQTIQLLQDVLLTLAFVHEQGVIHRDVKPDNLIRRWEDDKLVLVDFGAVKKIWSRNAAQNQVAGTIIGTLGYMATEQGRGKPRPSSDIYALGMVAVQAITGIAPMSLQEDSETGETIWQQYAKASPGLVAIIDKMIRYHFRDRFQSAKEVLVTLDQLTNAAPDFVPNLNPVQVVAKEEEEIVPTHHEETFYGQVALLASEESAASRDATILIPSANPILVQPTFPVASQVSEQTDKPAQTPTVLSAEEPTLSQLYPQSIPSQKPRVVPVPPLPPGAVKSEAVSEKSILVGIWILAALVIGTVGFFALKPPSPALKQAESVNTTAATVPAQIPTISTSTEKSVILPTTTVQKSTPPPVTAIEKPAVAVVSPPKKLAIQSKPSQPTLKPKPRRRPVIALRTPTKRPIKPLQKFAFKRPMVVLRPVRPEGMGSPFKAQPTPINSASDSLKPAATPVQPPD